MSSISLWLVPLLALLFLKFLWRPKKSPALAPLPPGPPAEFLLGYARIFPREQPHHQLAQWAKRYGDVMHFKILGKNLIVLSSQSATYDLLDKRGSIYSSRPRFPTFELTGWAHQHSFMPYSKEYMRYQKWFQNSLGARQAATYQPIQLKHARALMRNLSSTASDIATDVARFGVSIIIEVFYGPDMAQDANIDRIIELTQDITRKLAAMGDTSFVDLFPFLIHFPSWFPGIRCLAVARDTWKTQQELEYMPFEELRRRVAAGQAYPALLASHLDKLEREGRTSKDELAFLRTCANTAVEAGSETTWSSIMNFLAAMLLFPHVQTKAQEELDRVVGCDRLPDFSDRKSLPYIQCIVHETMRWHPVVPFAIPHLNMEDDVYKNMFIPKGSTILANATAMAYDESVYRDPEMFSPERFLPDRGEPIPTNIAFGHGRRICPGRHLADSSLWIAFASLLAMFNIRPALDSEGKEVTPNIKFTTAFTSNPEPFQCRLIPRKTGLRVLAESFGE